MNLQERLSKMDSAEIERCKNDLLYYYNNYIRKSNDPVLNEDEFKKLQYQWKLNRAGKMIAKPIYGDIALYPLTDKDLFKNRL